MTAFTLLFAHLIRTHYSTTKMLFSLSKQQRQMAESPYPSRLEVSAVTTYIL